MPTMPMITGRFFCVWNQQNSSSRLSWNDLQTILQTMSSPRKQGEKDEGRHALKLILRETYKPLRKWCSIPQALPISGDGGEERGTPLLWLSTINPAYAVPASSHLDYMISQRGRSSSYWVGEPFTDSSIGHWKDQGCGDCAHSVSKPLLSRAASVPKTKQVHKPRVAQFRGNPLFSLGVFRVRLASKWFLAVHAPCPYTRTKIVCLPQTRRATTSNKRMPSLNPNIEEGTQWGPILHRTILIFTLCGGSPTQWGASQNGTPRAGCRAREAAPRRPCPSPPSHRSLGRSPWPEARPDDIDSYCG